MNIKLRIFSVSISLLLALLIVFFSGVLISRNINYKRMVNESILEYKVNNNVDYMIEVDSNYDKDVDKENIISSIINNIKLKFNYNLDLEKDINTKSNYIITSKLVINQLKDLSVTHLVNEEKEIIKKEVYNSSLINIEEEVLNDYKYYYDYFKNYKAKYPISGMDAKVIYTFKVNTKGIYNGGILDDTSESSVSISLSDSITNIKKNEVNSIKNVYIEKELPLINNVFMFVIGIIMFIIGLILLIPLFMAINLVNKQNEYKRELKNILKIYDDIIVEASEKIDTTNKEIVEVVRFSELLDAEQELHIPIVHNEVVSNQESWFTISDDNKIWRFILKNKNIS